MSRLSIAKLRAAFAAYLSDTRGSVLTEYMVLVGAVALVCAAALVSLGIALVRSFEFVRGFVLYPFP